MALLSSASTARLPPDADLRPRRPDGPPAANRLPPVPDQPPPRPALRSFPQWRSRRAHARCGCLPMPTRGRAAQTALRPQAALRPTAENGILWDTHILTAQIPHPILTSHVSNFGPNSLKHGEIAESKAVLEEGGWSNLVCSREDPQKNVDFAVLFLGSKLQSSDISKDKQDDPALADTLKLSFTSSKFSMAFPCVAMSDDDKLENSFLSGFAENCNYGLGGNHVTCLMASQWLIQQGGKN